MTAYYKVRANQCNIQYMFKQSACGELSIANCREYYVKGSGGFMDG